MQYAWFLWSILLLIVWLGVYISIGNKIGRKEMLVVSFWTSLLGFSEPLFIPIYWNPPSVFDLAQKTGFDIESFIFAFAIGGLTVMIYESIFRIKHERISQTERHHVHHKFHLLALLSGPIIFVALLMSTNLNPIYSAIIALIGGGLFTWYCRPDLKKKMITSAFLFLGIYFLYFLTLITAFPSYVEKVWNFSTISGILILGIPLEELIFAFALGFLWSSVYEHIKWYKIKRV
ncbi:MAG: lycopene cyclase domain-containing protein [Patescibacteria group bacterium]|nr:lycopene cyclase domain-containing protein [Patescibacteria group bacterium]